MPRCPSCREVVLRDATFCPTCDFKLNPNAPDGPTVHAFMPAVPADKEPSNLQAIIGLVLMGWLGWQAYGAILGPREVASIKSAEKRTIAQSAPTSTEGISDQWETSTSPIDPAAQVPAPPPNPQADTPESPPTLKSVPAGKAPSTAVARESAAPVCGSKSLCKEMSSCAEAVYYLQECGLSRLDNDGDKIPCETVCGKSIGEMQSRVAAHPFKPPTSVQGLLGAEAEASAALKSDFECGRKRQCGQMESCDEANFYLTKCGVRSLDKDRDGVPCEAICN